MTFDGQCMGVCLAADVMSLITSGLRDNKTKAHSGRCLLAIRIKGAGHKMAVTHVKQRDFLSAALGAG